jgi:AraC-like DNA-binding protein
MRRRGNVELIVRELEDHPLVGAALPQLAHAGYAKAVDAGTWKVHYHPRLEIHFFVRGLLRCWVGRELYELSGGDVLVAPPNVAHGGWLGVRPPATLYWMALHPWDPASGEPLFGLSSLESQTLYDALMHLRVPCFRVGRALEAPFRALLDACPPKDGRDLFSLRRAVLNVLGTVLEAGRLPAVVATSDVVEAALAVMRENLETPLSVPELARRSGYSAAYLVREFHRIMGIGLKEDYVRRRVLEACRRMAEPGTEITRVAHALGFTSSQYFATVFKRVTGLSPSGYQKACASSKRAPSDAEHWLM